MLDVRGKMLVEGWGKSQRNVSWPNPVRHSGELAQPGFASLRPRASRHRGHRTNSNLRAHLFRFDSFALPGLAMISVS